VFSKSKIFKFLKRDWGTIPVAEIINGKIEFFSKHQRFLIATESSKYLLIFVLYVCVICHSRCFGIRGGHGKSAFKLAVKLSVELGYVFLSLRS
jgi:hypothetical protein